MWGQSGHTKAAPTASMEADCSARDALAILAKGIQELFMLMLREAFRQSSTRRTGRETAFGQFRQSVEEGGGRSRTGS